MRVLLPEMSFCSFFRAAELFLQVMISQTLVVNPSWVDFLSHHLTLNDLFTILTKTLSFFHSNWDDAKRDMWIGFIVSVFLYEHVFYQKPSNFVKRRNENAIRKHRLLLFIASNRIEPKGKKNIFIQWLSSTACRQHWSSSRISACNKANIKQKTWFIRNKRNSCVQHVDI